MCSSRSSARSKTSSTRSCPRRTLEADRTDLDGATSILDLASIYGIELPANGGFETIAGYMLFKLGHIPKAGEAVEFDGRRFTVADMDRNRIAAVRIETDLAGEPRVQPQASARERWSRKLLGIDPKAARYTWTAALVLLLLGTVYLIREALIVFVIALLFAYLLYPLMDLIDRHLTSKTRTPALAILLFSSSVSLRASESRSDRWSPTRPRTWRRRRRHFWTGIRQNPAPGPNGVKSLKSQVIGFDRRTTAPALQRYRGGRCRGWGCAFFRLRET